MESILNAGTNQYTDPDIVARLAHLYVSTGATASAFSLLDRMLAAQQPADAYASAAGIAITAGDTNRANRWVDQALVRKPTGSSAQKTALVLASLGRCPEALDVAIPLTCSLGEEQHHFYAPVIEALVRKGMKPVVVGRLQALETGAATTNVPDTRLLAKLYGSAHAYSNAAACWKRVVKVSASTYDYQGLIEAFDRMGDVSGSLDARTEMILLERSNWPGRKLGWFQELSKSMHLPGQTNRLETVSDALLADTRLEDCHQECMANVFESLGMPDRTIRHLRTRGINSKNTDRILSILLKHRRHDELVGVLAEASGHLGKIAVARKTLAECVAALGSEKWDAIVATGEAPGATVAQQVMAVYMLTGSNLADRARNVLLRSYAGNPGTGVFDMLKENYAHTRDHAAVFSLYTNRLDRVPALRRDGQFILDLLSASSKANPAAGHPFARQLLVDFPKDGYAKWQVEQWLLNSGYYDEAFNLCTNILAEQKDHANVFQNLVWASERMSQPADGLVSALYFAQPHGPDHIHNLILDQFARNSVAWPVVIRWAETVQNGKSVNCPFADKVDWNRLYRRAVELSRDSTRLAAIRRKDFEKTPSPAAARALAAALVNIGSIDEAITLQTQALKDTPQDERPPARMELIRMLVAARRYATARAMVEESLASTMDPSGRKTLDAIRTEITNGERQDAFVEETVRKADLAPTDASLQRSAAQSLRLTGRLLKAADYYRRAMAIEDQTATRWDLACVLAATGKHGDAVEVYLSILPRDISDQERDAAIKSIAESHEAMGKKKKALEFLTARQSEIRAPGVRNWATARIKALREEAE